MDFLPPTNPTFGRGYSAPALLQAPSSTLGPRRGTVAGVASQSHSQSQNRITVSSSSSLLRDRRANQRQRPRHGTSKSQNQRPSQSQSQGQGQGHGQPSHMARDLQGRRWTIGPNHLQLPQSAAQQAHAHAASVEPPRAMSSTPPRGAVGVARPVSVANGANGGNGSWRMIKLSLCGDDGMRREHVLRVGDMVVARNAQGVLTYIGPLPSRLGDEAGTFLGIDVGDGEVYVPIAHFQRRITAHDLWDRLREEQAQKEKLEKQLQAARKETIAPEDRVAIIEQTLCAVLKAVLELKGGDETTPSDASPQSHSHGLRRQTQHSPDFFI